MRVENSVFMVVFRPQLVIRKDKYIEIDIDIYTDP